MSTRNVLERIAGRESKGVTVEQLHSELAKSQSRGKIAAHLGQLVESRPEFVWLRVRKENGWLEYNYRDLSTQIDRFRHFYRERLPENSLVLIVLREGIELFASFLAAMFEGMKPAFFAYPSPKQSEESFLEAYQNLRKHAEPSLVVAIDAVSDLLVQKLGVLSEQIVSESQITEYADREIELEPWKLSRKFEQFIQFSSGTTGAKKGVCISSTALFNQVEAYEKVVELTEKSHIVSWLPHYHDMGLIACMLMPLIRGVPVAMMSPFDWVKRPDMLWEGVTKFSGTHVWLPNFALDHSVRCNRAATSDNSDGSERIDLSSLVRIVGCSEPVLPPSVARFQKHFSQFGLNKNVIANCYAMAENTFAMASTSRQMNELTVDAGKLQREGIVEVTNQGRTLSSSGRPLQNIQIEIRDNQGVNLGEDRVGEIVIRSNCLADGYFQNAEATAQAFEQGWFRTGDQGFMHQGELYVTGRIKDLIIVGGENVFPHDIQEILNSEPTLIPGRSVVFGIEDERLGTEKIVVLAESKWTPTEVPVSQIRSRVFAALNVSIAEFIVLPHQTLKKSTAGKISNYTNKQAFLDGAFREFLAGERPSLIPVAESEMSILRSPGVAEQKIREAILAVVPSLNGDEIGNDSRLLTSGLIDSFGIVEFIAELEKSFSLKIPQQLWSHHYLDTVPEIAELIEKLKGDRQGIVEPELLGNEAKIQREVSRERLLQVKSFRQPGKQTWKEWLINSWPIPSTFAYRSLLRAIGVKVGQGVTFTGRIKIKIRGKAENIQIGDGVLFGRNIDLRNRENGKIIIRNGAYIDDNVRLVAARDGKIEVGVGAEIGGNTIINSGGATIIGDLSMIAGNVNINSSSHGTELDSYVADQAHTHGTILIGPDVWVGSGASIVMNSEIGEGAVIGSNSVVSGKVPSFAICAGIPAKVIRYRAAKTSQLPTQKEQSQRKVA